MYGLLIIAVCLQSNDTCQVLSLAVREAFVYILRITYLLTPWSRVLLEKLTGFAANQEIPHILWYLTVHHRTHRRPPPVPILNHISYYLI